MLKLVFINELFSKVQEVLEHAHKAECLFSLKTIGSVCRRVWSKSSRFSTPLRLVSTSWPPWLTVAAYTWWVTVCFVWWQKFDLRFPADVSPLLSSLKDYVQALTGLCYDGVEGLIYLVLFSFVTALMFSSIVCSVPHTWPRKRYHTHAPPRFLSCWYETFPLVAWLILQRNSEETRMTNIKPFFAKICSPNFLPTWESIGK